MLDEENNSVKLDVSSVRVKEDLIDFTELLDL